MYDTIDKYFKHFKNLPECQIKKKWREVFIGMATHTRGRKPEELLLKRRPNEEPEIQKYRGENFRPITYGSMNKALDDCYRIVSGISYTINAPDNVKDYIHNTVVGSYSKSLNKEIINPKLFIEKITLKRGIEDPNGFLIWFPGGEGVEDSSKKVVPKPKLVLCTKYHYSDDTVFIYQSEEKSELKEQDGKIVKSGEVWYFITKTDFWKMYQKGTVENPEWEQNNLYRHSLGTFPVIVLGGDLITEEEDESSEAYYESFFSPYRAFGDEAIHQFSDWQAIMTTSSFPIKEEFMNECSVRIENKDSTPSDGEEVYRGGANGDQDGQVMKLVGMSKSPYNTILRKIPLQNINDDTLPVEIESVRYINPPIDIAKYSGESWVMLIEKAEDALNIDMTVGVDQSGKAKQLDKEAQYSMITKIGNNFFDNIYLNSLKIIDGYINRVPFAQSSCSINKPSTFWVKNELDLIHEITTLKSSNAPSFFLSEATLDLAKKRFNGNPVNEKLFKFISLYDPYYIYTTAEKNNLLASAVMTKEDYIRSLRMFSILNQMVEELTPVGFIDLTYEEMSKMFDTKVKVYFPAQVIVETDDNGNPV